jgi:hypothetical protein
MTETKQDILKLIYGTQQHRTRRFSTKAIAITLNSHTSTVVQWVQTENYLKPNHRFHLLPPLTQIEKLILAKTTALLSISETNRIQLILSVMQNRTFGPYLAANNWILILN